jgi:serine/threonine protein kinase
MSPELVDREPSDAFSCDVWALGITFYQLAFGRLPYASKSGPELAREISAAVFEVPRDAGEPFAKVLERMLDREPGRRPTMAQVVEMPYFTAGHISVASVSRRASSGALTGPSAQALRLFSKSSGRIPAMDSHSIARRKVPTYSFGDEAEGEI